MFLFYSCYLHDKHLRIFYKEFTFKVLEYFTKASQRDAIIPYLFGLESSARYCHRGETILFQIKQISRTYEKNLK